MKKHSLNLVHPELKEGEIFLANTTEGINWCGWKTKRLGIAAYDVHGNNISPEGFRPIFVQRSELKAAGMTTSPMGEAI